MTRKLWMTALLFTASLSADPIITFGPGGSAATAPAGGIAGWDVFVSPDPTFWVSFVDTQIVAEDNPVGLYTDLLGFFGGPVDALFPPASGDYTGLFNLANGTGLGYYTIDPSAPFGAIDNLSIEVDYSLLDGDPFTCASCSVVGSGFVTLDGSVSVPTPEPGAFVLLLVAAVSAFLSNRAKVMPELRSGRQAKCPPYGGSGEATAEVQGPALVFLSIPRVIK